MAAQPGHSEPLTNAACAGFVVVDKPYRKSSTSIVTLVRGRLRAGGLPKSIKVGHAGTLDPLATGVLVVLVGRATRLSERVMEGAKTYEARVDLSRTSDTDDLEGVIADVPCEAPPKERIEALLAERFTGVIQQTPPAHSAMRIGGRHAYELARKGRETPLSPRPVRIDAIRIAGYDWPMLDLVIDCGKGTYIRSMARDIGAALGTGGVLAGLRRTRVGAFTIEQARTPDALPDPLTLGDLLVTPEAQALRDAEPLPAEG